MNTICACGNTLIWLSEIMAGECDACAWHRSWLQLMDKWDAEFRCRRCRRELISPDERELGTCDYCQEGSGDAA